VPPTVVKEVETCQRRTPHQKRAVSGNGAGLPRYRQQRLLDDERVIMKLIAETKAEESRTDEHRATAQ